MSTNQLDGLTAQEFFAKGLDGCSMSDAHFATRIAYSSIHALAHGKVEPRVKTVSALEGWSRAAGAPHGVYISAAKTLGLSEPVSGEAA